MTIKDEGIDLVVMELPVDMVWISLPLEVLLKGL